MFSWSEFLWPCLPGERLQARRQRTAECARFSRQCLCGEQDDTMRYLHLINIETDEQTATPAGDDLLVTDGPFVETKEYLAGALPVAAGLPGPHEDASG
jgi:hypothetical protein